MRALVGAIALVSMFVAPASAAGWTFTPLVFPQVEPFIEQQSDWPPDPNGRYVISPLSSCAWDVDDHWSYVASGALQSGQQVSRTDCHISDASAYLRTLNGVEAWWSSNRGRHGLLVLAPKPGLVATVCYTVQARCFTATPFFDGSQYVYALCSQAVYPDNRDGLHPLPSVAGSNGGVGIVDQVVATVTNSTNKRINNISVAVSRSGVVLDQDGCRETQAETLHTDSPWRWWD